LRRTTPQGRHLPGNPGPGVGLTGAQIASGATLSRALGSAAMVSARTARGRRARFARISPDPPRAMV